MSKVPGEADSLWGMITTLARATSAVVGVIQVMAIHRRVKNVDNKMDDQVDHLVRRNAQLLKVMRENHVDVPEPDFRPKESELES